MSFIKPANYENSKTRKYKNDPGRAENTEYDKDTDTYTCKKEEKFKASSIKKRKTKGGYGQEVIIYSCAECSGCPYKKECIKGNNSKKPLEEYGKNLQVSKQSNQYRKEDLERITSKEEKILRMNRSILMFQNFPGTVLGRALKVCPYAI